MSSQSRPTREQRHRPYHDDPRWRAARDRLVAVKCFDVGKLGHCRAWGPGWNGLSETRAAQLVGVDRQASDIHALGEDRRPREDLPLPDELRPRRNGSLLMDPADQIEAVLAVLAAAIPGASWTYVNGGTWTITLAGKESR